VLNAALAQLPVTPHSGEVICRTDAGGTSHELAAGCRQRHVQFIGGVRLSAQLAETVLSLPRSRWQPTISADGSEIRETGEVAELTDLVELSGWQAHTRMLVRREQPHPGAQLRFTDLDGYRYQLFVTDLPDADLGYLEARSTAAAAGWSVLSATPKTPSWPICPPMTSRSTPPG
jgi:Transposase DDE domain group 1